MKITEEQVRYVADLANLKLTSEEISRMVHDMDEILTHMDKLSELDTTNVEPMAQVLFGDHTAGLREDVVKPTIPNAEALANAPVSSNGYFKVPKVIER